MQRVPSRSKTVFLMAAVLSCLFFLAVLAGPPATGPAAAAPAAPEAEDPGWPREFQSNDWTVSIFQPQLDRWEGNQLEGRAAVAAKRAIDAKPMYGVVWFAGQTEVDKVNRLVTLSHVKLTRTQFPMAKDQESALLVLMQVHLGEKVQTISLDRIEAALAQTDVAGRVQGLTLRNDPPRIIYSNVLALLVLVDGGPVLRPMEGTKLQRVVNTRVLLVKDPANGHFYLHLMEGWMEAPALDAAWNVARKVSGDLKKAAKSAASSRQIDLLPGPPRADDPQKLQTLPEAAKSATVPVVYLSSTPAELIQTEGPPKTEAIPGTSLAWITNTGTNLFVDSASGNNYVLISGRWFRSGALAGPWEYVAGRDLPADFGRIPANHPKASVLVSVPGTDQAMEALIANSIPQTATIQRQAATLTVTYDGAPEFKPIEGTTLQYAVNAKTPVIKVDEKDFFAVENGVWFAASTPLGPWAVATAVPPAIYSIPPSSPVHNVTYVKIYGSSAEVVYVGYTPGYYGTVVSTDQVVVYGTGWYYPPYLGMWWYGWPCTYGYGATFVWSSEGGWAIGFGVGYGYGWYYPYWGPWGWYGYGWYPAWGWHGWGGFASANVYGRWGDTVYHGTRAAWANPWTGNYGSAARHSSYNPQTGTLVTAGRVNNTNIYTGNQVQAAGGVVRNTETGVIAGGGAVRVDNIYNGDSAQGGGGFIYDTDDHKGIAAGKENVYAGKDGNVYRYDKDEGTWSKHGDDGWEPVDGPDKQGQVKEARDSASRREGQPLGPSEQKPSLDRERGGATGGMPDREFNQQLQQLQRDSRARSTGNQRYRNFRSTSGANRSSWSGGARRGGRR